LPLSPIWPGFRTGITAAFNAPPREGIARVNTAVLKIDRIVRQNPEKTEQSASTSEEMNAQVEQTGKRVNELVAVVGDNVRKEVPDHRAIG